MAGGEVAGGRFGGAAFGARQRAAIGEAAAAHAFIEIWHPAGDDRQHIDPVFRVGQGNDLRYAGVGLHQRLVWHGHSANQQSHRRNAE